MATILPAPSGVTVFQGRATAAINLGATANTITAIPLGLNDQDDLSGHSTSTQTTRYVCKKAGRYSVVGAVLLAANSTAATSANFGRVSIINKNGSGVQGSSYWAPYVTSSIMTLPTFEIIIPLAVNDYVELAASSNLANTMTYYDANHHSIMRVDFIG